jgi:two-component system, NtrC family, response regulator GlrR
VDGRTLGEIEDHLGEVGPEFGSMVGISPAMRATFQLLEQAARSDVTVLLEGETGTGKEAAAVSIHQNSRRQPGPFVVVDCSALPVHLLESELFGHEKGAFTDAASRRLGYFEEASGGTVFLDEIGEIPIELQPKLLRVLEERHVRHLGSNALRPVDVRVIAASNRDLAAEVRSGRFRADLYYRVAVYHVRLPPLRERRQDIPLLVERLLAALRAEPERAAALITPAFLAGLECAPWPGNVRELRNHLERCLALQRSLPPVISAAPRGAGSAGEGKAPASYRESRSRALEAWERQYVEALLRAHSGDMDAAARSAGIARSYLYRLAGRHQLVGQRRPSRR